MMLTSPDAPRGVSIGSCGGAERFRRGKPGGAADGGAGAGVLKKRSRKKNRLSKYFTII